MGGVTTRETCRLCGSSELERLLTLPSTPLANSYPSSPEEGLTQERFDLYLVGCSSCGHVQLPVVVDPERLFPVDYPYQSGTSPVFREHLVKLASVFAGEGLSVLDVACNDGTFVNELRQQGVSAYGVDPAAPGGAYFWRAFLTEDFARAAAQAGHRFGAVTALNVFAHVDNLDDFTRGVKTLLEPCGLFVVEVGYLSDVVRRGLFDVIYHEHLSYHHLSPLVRFFRKHGMTLVDAQRIDSQGGSVRLFVRNCSTEHVGGDDGHNRPSKRLQDLLDEESRSQLWEGVKLLGNVKAGWGIRGARDNLKAWARSGKLVCYGAPAKLTTLLHATDQVDAVDYVCDDNPLKQGRFVPGTAIPILPVSTLYERRPKRVLVTAWNFAGDIMKKHAELGCEWVVSDG